MEQNNPNSVNQREGKELSFPSRYGRMTVVTSTYAKGNALAVELVADDGESLAMLSVNIPDRTHLLGEGEFFAKTWSENEEVAADAMASGIFRGTGRTSEDELNTQIWQFR